MGPVLSMNFLRLSTVNATVQLVIMESYAKMTHVHQVCYYPMISLLNALVPTFIYYMNYIMYYMCIL